MAFRDGPFETIKVPLVWTAAVAVVVVLIMAGLMIANDRRNVEAGDTTHVVRSGFDKAAAPVGGVLSAPVRWVGSVGDGIGGYFFAVSENRRLKTRVAELEAWRDDAIALKNVNARYEAMLGLRTDPPVPMVTGRAVSDVRGPFVNARLLDVGSDRGVRVGNPAINEHGLIGRIVGTTTGASRMLLATDVSSRLPILIDRTDARALMVGDGSGSPRLNFIRGTNTIQAGDRVLSSGDGGGLPRGMPIGVAAKGVDGVWRVKLYSDRGAIDYVRVLLFQNFGQLVNPGALNAAPLMGLTTAPPPSASEAATITDAATRRTVEAATATRAQAATTAARQAAATPRPAPASRSPAVAAPSAAAPLNTAPASPVTTPVPVPPSVPGGPT